MFSFYACIDRNEGPDDSASRSHRFVLESGTSSMKSYGRRAVHILVYVQQPV
jgi:hypothetical protein